MLIWNIHKMLQLFLVLCPTYPQNVVKIPWYASRDAANRQTDILTGK